MARLFADGFDHYGTDETNMIDGVYASIDASVTLTTAQVATGTHSVFIDFFANNSAPNGLRKVLPSAVTKMGAAGRFYFPGLPSGNTSAAIFDFLSADIHRPQVTCYVDANGRLLFYKDANWGLSGGAGTLIATSDPIVTSNAWNHIEVQVYSHATAGWVRAAINGVHRFQATNLDTLFDASGIVSVASHQPYYGTSAGINPGDFYMDDYILYDFTGTPATDTDFAPTVDGAGIGTNYIAELQVRYLPVNGDTAQMNWVASSGPDKYAMVDETTPNDADYIYSTAAGNLSEFSVTDLPIDITYIRGVDFWGRLSKNDSGAAQTKFGSKSVAATTDAAARPLTVEATYYWDQINLDPNTSARWTKAGLDASWFRITRSL